MCFDRRQNFRGRRKKEKGVSGRDSRDTSRGKDFSRFL